MKLEILNDAPYNQNCYFIINEETKEAVIIDPGYQLEKINNKIEELELKIVSILVTHFHFDHNASANYLASKHNVKIRMHSNDALTAYKDTLTKWANVDHFVLDEKLVEPFQDDFTVPGFDIKAIFAPGHTHGSVLYVFENMMFTGDVLFIDSIGRYDLSTANLTDHVNTLKRIWKMSDQLMVYPGHGDNASLRDIKEKNEIFIQAVAAQQR